MKEYIFLGDSITDCDHIYTEDGLGEGYVKNIAQALATSSHCLNLGYDGFTISALNRMWNMRSASLNPSCISILIGINDIAVIKNTGLNPDSALEAFQANYEILIENIRQRFDCPIILMETFILSRPAEYITWIPLVQRLNEIIKEIACKYNLYFLPLWSALADSSLSTDGIHLTEKGQRILADLWLHFSKNENLI